MNCRKVHRLIQTVADGAAERDDRLAVERHVADCPDCARLLQETRRLLVLMATMPRREPGEAFERNLADAISHTAPASLAAAWWQRARLRMEWRLRRPALTCLWTAASLALAVVAASRLSPTHQDRQRETQFVSATIERHRQLQYAPLQDDANWEAIHASIEMNTGSFVE